jgi:hypothetical protein
LFSARIAAPHPAHSQTNFTKKTWGSRAFRQKIVTKSVFSSCGFCGVSVNTASPKRKTLKEAEDGTGRRTEGWLRWKLRRFEGSLKNIWIQGCRMRQGIGGFVYFVSSLFEN